MDDYQLLIDKALKFLSFRPRTKKEMVSKLQNIVIKRGISQAILDKVILDLEQKNLINDKEFVTWWINQRDTFRPKGRKLIKIELRNKGIEKEIIDEVLEEEENPKSHEFEMALTLAQKRISRLSSYSKEKVEEKITALLSRRGFNWEVVHKVIDTITKKD